VHICCFCCCAFFFLLLTTSWSLWGVTLTLEILLPGVRSVPGSQIGPFCVVHLLVWIGYSGHVIQSIQYVCSRPFASTIRKDC
jgi:hypothetical protein